MLAMAMANPRCVASPGGVAKPMSTMRPSSKPQRQRGIALFVGLALLTALAGGGLAAAQTTILELRMARNQHDAALALHAAEFALLTAEAWLQANAADPTALFAANGNGLHRAAGYGETVPWRDAGAWNAARAAATVPNVSAQPRYLVEWLSTRTDTGTATNPQPPLVIDIFRITARGTGERASVMLQSTYGQERGNANASRTLTGRLSWVEVGG